MRTYTLRKVSTAGLLLSIVFWCFALTQCVIPANNMSNVEKNQLK